MLNFAEDFRTEKNLRSYLGKPPYFKLKIIESQHFGDLPRSLSSGRSRGGD